MRFGKFNAYCMVCGCKMRIHCCSEYGGKVCSEECWKKLEVYRVRSICGKDTDTDHTASFPKTAPCPE